MTPQAKRIIKLTLWTSVLECILVGMALALLSDKPYTIVFAIFSPLLYIWIFIIPLFIATLIYVWAVKNTRGTSTQHYVKIILVLCFIYGGMFLLWSLADVLLLESGGTIMLDVKKQFLGFTPFIIITPIILLVLDHYFNFKLKDER